MPFDKLQDTISGLKKIKGSKVLLDEPMSKHTTFKIGGPADIVFIPDSINGLKKALKVIRSNKAPYILIGNGSNILFCDDPYCGVVIRIAGSMNKFEIKKDKVRAESGAYIKKLIVECAKAGLSGLEYLTGIPAAVGGALYMNAGSFGFDIGGLVEDVEMLTRDGRIVRLQADECAFSYRNSIFQTNNCIVLRANFRLKNDDPVAIGNRADAYLKVKAYSQPVGMACAGCVFRNTATGPAGKLIEQAGLKGARIGGAQVSELHANYIVNTGGATARDVTELIDRIKGIVLEKYKEDLKLEIKLAGFPEQIA